MSSPNAQRSLASRIAIAGAIAMVLMIATYVGFEVLGVISEKTFRVLFAGILIVESIIVMRMVALRKRKTLD